MYVCVSVSVIEACVQMAKQRKATSPPVDPGYFGKGIYFTQYPSYGAKYAREASCMLVSWVMLGRPYPVIEPPSHDDPRSLSGKGTYTQVGNLFTNSLSP